MVCDVISFVVDAFVDIGTDDKAVHQKLLEGSTLGEKNRANLCILVRGKVNSVISPGPVEKYKHAARNPTLCHSEPFFSPAP